MGLYSGHAPARRRIRFTLTGHAIHTMIFHRILILASLAAFSGAAAAASPATNPLATLAERSGFVRTGRYEEVERLCTAYQTRWPTALRCHEFGRTPEGRPMLA